MHTQSGCSPLVVRDMCSQVQLVALSLHAFEIRDCTAEPLSTCRLLTKKAHNSLKPRRLIG